MHYYEEINTITALERYLPIDRGLAIATNQPIPDRADGAVLFADISSFTPFTAALKREYGKLRGAEALTEYLDIVYEALISKIENYCGSVIGFSGDAITCWYRGTKHDASCRAVASAIAMQKVMNELATHPLLKMFGREIELKVKIAIVYGKVPRFKLGDEKIQCLDVLAGKTLVQLSLIEKETKPGQIKVDSVVANVLQKILRKDSQFIQATEFANLLDEAIWDRIKVIPENWPVQPDNVLTSDQLRPWLLPPVFDHLIKHNGVEKYLRRLQPAVPLFLKFSGLDYDKDPQVVTKFNDYVKWFQRILASYDASLMHLTVGDKGSYFSAVFGAPVIHEDDVERALCAAQELSFPPSDLEVKTVGIGICFGEELCVGPYGGPTRHTYGIMADEVNLAARLMSEAVDANEILVSSTTYSLVRNKFRWDTIRHVPHIKGKFGDTSVYPLQKTGKTKYYLSLQKNSITILNKEELKLRTQLTLIGRVDSEILLEKHLPTLLEMTEGNPSILDEYLLLLKNYPLNSLQALDIPPKLKQQILSSLNQLSEEEKRVLEFASIFDLECEEYWICQLLSIYLPNLVANLTDHLSALAQRSYLSNNKSSTVKVWKFQSRLVQRVIYEALPVRWRSELHEKMGDYFEENNTEKNVEAYKRLAYHYGQSFNLDKRNKYLLLANEQIRW